MKIRHLILFVIVFSLFVVSASAQWHALSSGYGATTNWHGEEVPVGESVTAWAGTTDPDVTDVLFRWRYPDDTVYTEVTVPIDGPYTTPTVPTGVPQEIIDWANAHPGIDVYYADDTQTPDEIGDWGVTVLFIGPGGTTKADVDEVIAIRATSFEAVPEVAIVGSAGAAIAMLLGLGCFYRKKEQTITT
jgi:hypothetical protein